MRGRKRKIKDGVNGKGDKLWMRFDEISSNENGRRLVIKDFDFARKLGHRDDLLEDEKNDDDDNDYVELLTARTSLKSTHILPLKLQNHRLHINGREANCKKMNSVYLFGAVM